MNAKRVQRIWRRVEPKASIRGIDSNRGLKVPQKQLRRGRLRLNDGYCVRLRAIRPHRVLNYRSSVPEAVVPRSPTTLP